MWNFGSEDISGLKVEEIPSFRIVTKLVIVELERTAIDGVESGISSRIVKSNTLQGRSREIVAFLQLAANTRGKLPSVIWLN